MVRHIQNAFREGELVRSATCANFAQVRTEAGRSVTREIEYFNLDKHRCVIETQPDHDITAPLGAVGDRITDAEAAAIKAVVATHWPAWWRAAVGDASMSTSNVPWAMLACSCVTDGTASVDVRLEHESVWLTQRQMADVFDTTPENVLTHLRNVYSIGSWRPGQLLRIA